uniref:Uncharacterized protein n=1 Tax=Leviviridae sp. TaxID=2027243 RepID=A0A514DBB8_9VIRU|nr:MAG: hypothetical protein H2RhizoLitter7333_000002 [Leviviridae sp.]
MTAAASITIKKNDGTTDVVWSLLAASGGDKSPAVWRSGTATGTAGQQPTLTIQSRDNGDKTARRTDMTFVFPSVYTDAASGLTKVRSKAIVNVSAVLPLDMTSADINEQGAQFAHLLNAALVVGTLQSGYAPT